MRTGALRLLKLRDLKRIDEVYKITVHSGDKEEYFNFCTPECAREIDTYLDFRKRHGERLTGDSNLLTKKFDTGAKIEGFTGKSFGKYSIPTMLENFVRDSGLRTTDYNNRYKRKESPVLHGFRKF